MKPAVKFILSIAMLLGLAGAGLVMALTMLNSLTYYRSPIHSNPPGPLQPVGNPVNRRTVIVLIDALRLDTSLDRRLMPNLNHLRDTGASAVMHSRPPSFSGPGYSTLFTGAWPFYHDGPVFTQEYESLITWTQDNLFSAASRNGIKTGIAGWYWFGKLVPQADVDVKQYVVGEDAAADAVVMSAAMEWLDDQSTALYLIHLDQVDYAGHYTGGPQGKQWKEAAAAVDAMLGEIIGKLDPDLDTIIVLSDHGQIPAGGHGGHDADVLVEPFVMAGKGIVPGEYADIQMVDVAPTIALLLGTNYPASSAGAPQVKMLDMPVDRLEAFENQKKESNIRLHEAFAYAIGEFPAPEWTLEQTLNARVKRERLLRLPVALLLLVIPPILFFRREKRIQWALLAAGLSNIAVFLLRYIVIDRMPFSFSVIKSAGWLLSYTGITAGVATVFGCLVLYLLLHRRVDADRWTATTLQYILVSCFFWLIPVLYNFWNNGLYTTWMLPEIGSYFMGLLGWIMFLFTAVTGVVLVAISARLSPRRLSDK